MAEAAEFLILTIVTVLIGMSLITSLGFALLAITIALRCAFHYLKGGTK